MRNSLFLFCLILPVFGYSQNNLSNEELSRLSSNTEWLALLHYRQHAVLTRNSSYIVNDEFFLHPNGKFDAKAELEATVSALNAPVKTNTNKHAACLFPARRLWIEAHSSMQISDVACREYSDWAQLDSVDSISMVFATGHFKNPASFFGHNFLKLNSKGSESYLLDPSINFGAKIPPNENPLFYLAKGIGGVYDAQFTREPFYRFLAKYGEQDLRDIWEYRLDLSPHQRHLIIAHLWEVKDAVFPYYFFRENCAYQIASVLGIITNTEFVPQYLPWAMPITVFDRMMNAPADQQALVTQVDFYQSRRTEFQNRFAKSTAAEKRLITRYSNDETVLNTESFEALPRDRQIWLIDTLLDYVHYRIREDDLLSDKERQRQLLLARLKFGTGAKQEVEVKPPVAPHLGQRPGIISLGAVNRYIDSDRNNAAQRLGVLKIRPAYYDFLGLPYGRKPYSSFTVLDSTFTFSDDNVKLERIDLVNVSSLSTNHTGIKNDKALSWHARIGNERLSNTCKDCQAWLLDWEIGKSFRVGQRLVAFAVAGARLQENRQGRGFGGLQLHAGISGRLAKQIFVHASYGLQEHFNARQAYSEEWSLETRFGQSRWWDIRLGATQRDTLQYGGSIGLYW
jgi:hypothetical protein